MKVQVSLGCFTHAHIYPEASSSWREAAPWRAAVVLITGSGVSWLNMSGLLGSLIFRFAMVQQATITIIMLWASPSMCHRSLSLQKGHIAVHSMLMRSCRHIIPFYHVIAAKFPLVSLSRMDAIDNVIIDAGSDSYGLEVCNAYQPAILLLFGLIAPTLYLFYREMRSRMVFAEEYITSRFSGFEQIALSPRPSILQYWDFAVPACGALYIYVANSMVFNSE
jgi:hypothetical protein